MATRRRATSSEIVDLSDALNKFGKSAPDIEKRLLKAMSAGKALSQGLIKDIGKVQKHFNKQNADATKQIIALTKNYKNLNSEQRLQLANLQEETQEREEAITTLERMKDSTDSLSKSFKILGAKMVAVGGAVKLLKAPFSLLKKVFGALVSSYDNWFRLEQNWTSSMASLRMEHGLTANQALEAQGAVEMMRRSFGDLTSEVDGIQITSQYVGQLASGLRMTGGELNNVAFTMAAVSRATGLAGESLNSVFRLLTTGVEDANATMEEWFIGMNDLADNLGVPVNALVNDFQSASSDVARFGREGMTAFRNAATMASRFGIEVSKILQSMKKFDMFQAASDDVNTLNAMFGTALSSFELMMETDPTRRLEMIRQSVMDTGVAWEDMHHTQRDALAEGLGVTVEEAARMFNDQVGFEQLDAEREERQRESRLNEQRQIDNSRMLHRILSSTAEVMESWGRYAQRIYNILSEAIGPIFREVFGVVGDTGDQLVKWTEELVQTEAFTSGIRGIAESIREIWDGIKTSISESGYSFADFKDHAGVVKDVFLGIADGMKWTYHFIKAGIDAASEFMDAFGWIFERIPDIMRGLGGFGVSLPMDALEGVSRSRGRTQERLDQVGETATAARITGQIRDVSAAAQFSPFQQQIMQALSQMSAPGAVPGTALASPAVGGMPPALARTQQAPANVSVRPQIQVVVNNNADARKILNTQAEILVDGAVSGVS